MFAASPAKILHFPQPLFNRTYHLQLLATSIHPSLPLRMRGSQTILFLLHRTHQASILPFSLPSGASGRMSSHHARQGKGTHNQYWKERPKQGITLATIEKMTVSGINSGDDSVSCARSGNLSSSVTDRIRELSPSALRQKTMWIPDAQRFSTSGMSTIATQTSPDVNNEEENKKTFIDDLKMKPQQNPGKVKGVYAQAQLRATFYPKFENEKSDQEIRMKMIEVVSSGKGVLEVSLKHSGSLFMYSGDHGGAFAKNSFGNLYTAVGVFVLGRTLQDAWGVQATEKQREFNDFLVKRRICISMELVTAVLGDHGQRPLKDYVVVTAVTELGGKPRFYSTPDLIAFCRQWRLPTNHIWLFSTRKTAASFFAAYDALCEEGTASGVSNVLDEIADISVPATKSHMEYQGEILEGLVARIVSPQSTERLKNVLRELSLMTSQDQVQFGPSLRKLCAANEGSEEQQIKALLENVGPHMCSDWSDWKSFGKGQPQVTTLFDKVLTASPADEMTTKLQEMIGVLRDRRMHVRFPCRPKSGHEDGKIQFKLTVHVLSDSVFRRYHKELRDNPGLWPLYRGFFVDVSLFDDLVKASSNGATSLTNDLSEKFENLTTIEDDVLADDAENLMIKLKLLPYKLRTFLIRNGLSILFEQGFAAYKQYYLRQMEIWGTSRGKQRELNQLLTEWAGYITKKCRGIKLKEGIYLSEAEPFLEEYASRSEKNRRLVGAAGSLLRIDDFLNKIEAAYQEESLEAAEPGDTDGKSKTKGLLVFFPGIPGCAKSALCREISNTPGDLGEGKPVQSLMGDMIKAKYWPKLADDRKRRPSVITLADKNAPNEEVWKQISEICRDTYAVGVPVVPDSEGTSSNPFSLDTLAIFIYRVLQRDNHPGNLDTNSPNAGYVLLMFYNLYEGKDRSEFEEKLLHRFGYLVKMPVLKLDRSKMPLPVTRILEEGLNLYKRHVAKHGKLDSTKGAFRFDWERWENRLREIMFSNSEHLNAIQVPFEEVVQNVREQLQAIVKGNVMLPKPLGEEHIFRTITYAAISLPPNEIVDLINRVSHSNEEFSLFFTGKPIGIQLKEAHVTLAHKRSHGVPAVAAYGALCGSKVPVQFTALLFSHKLCALEAHICASSDQEVTSKNEWPHVTVWTAEGTRPKEANTLPDLVSQRRATRLDINPPVIVYGVVNLM